MRSDHWHHTKINSTIVTVWQQHNECHKSDHCTLQTILKLYVCIEKFSRTCCNLLLSMPAYSYYTVLSHQAADESSTSFGNT